MTSIRDVDLRMLRSNHGIDNLGTAQDVTLQELRIECFHPSDEPTRRAAKALLVHSGGS
jgi:hypothetical protein